MNLSRGMRLGPYEVLSPLGAGGMGEVYRARDTRLGREIALKVLPKDFAADPERLRRFEGEARAASALTDPHIVAVFDVGSEDGVHFFASELVEGHDLRHLLDSGPVPLKKALDLAGQIASGLAAAHEKGIVHRDLKPENVLITKAGVAKIADFGLAKLTEAKVRDISQLPTTDGRQTTAGVVMGTVAYMSPEQARGEPVDHRSDIFSFGAVLYEMFSGRKAFERLSAVETMAAILKEEPPELASLGLEIPPRLGRLISVCLSKEPRDRWASLHDVQLQLEEISRSAPEVGSESSRVTRRSRSGRLAWGGLVAALSAALALAIFLSRRRATPDVVRFQFSLPAGVISAGSPRLSPDGRLCAFNAIDANGGLRLWVHAMSSLSARPIAGTEGAGRPFWSPDGRYLGFVAQGKLKKVAIGGGPPEEICDASEWGGEGTWSEDGTILFGGSENRPILRVSAAGGAPVPAVRPRGGSVDLPRFLPGGRAFLFAEISEAGRLRVRFSDVDGRRARDVIAGVSQTDYAPPGYLLFVRGGTLLAQRFDASTGRLSGDPVSLAEGMATDAFGDADFSVSRNGVLAYRTGDSQASQYVWYDREGRRSPPVAAIPDSANFDLSRDGRRLTFDRFTPGGFRVWIDDLARGVMSRVSADSVTEMCPLFTADGLRLIVARHSGTGSYRLISRALEGGDERLLDEEPKFPCPETLSPDGQTLVFDRAKGEDAYDLWSLNLGRPGSAAPLVAGKFSSSRASISPDGRWLAYQGNESGRDEVYVMPLAGSGTPWQVSSGGGREPEWGPGGTELYYVSVDSRLMRVSVRAGSRFDAGIGHALFPLDVSPVLGRNRYLVAPDGERFLVQSTQPGHDAAPVTIVLGWERLLER